MAQEACNDLDARAAQAEAALEAERQRAAEEAQQVCGVRVQVVGVRVGGCTRTLKSSPLAPFLSACLRQLQASLDAAAGECEEVAAALEAERQSAAAAAAQSEAAAAAAEGARAALAAELDAAQAALAAAGERLTAEVDEAQGVALALMGEKEQLEVCAGGCGMVESGSPDT